MHKSKKNAFTLAEVLITLLVIGIISVLVIPVFRASVGKKTLGAQLKKAVTVVTDAAQAAIEDEKGSDDAAAELNSDSGFYYTTSGTETSDSTQGVEYFLKKFFKYTQYCDKPEVERCVGEKYKTANGVNLGGIPETYRCIKTKNGAGICMYYDTDKFVKVIIDVNGGDKPNKTGVDTYVMKITDNGFVEDLDDDEDNCNKTTKQAKGASILIYGSGCLTRVINNGWKIPD